MEKKQISLSNFIRQLTRTMDDLTIRTFHFNPIMVNTMVLHDDTGDAVIVDPGNCQMHEDEQLRDYIREHNLVVKYIINTHPHVDHIAGNPWCVKEYRAPLCCHEAGMPIYERADAYGVAFGLILDPMPQPSIFLEEGEYIKFGNQTLQVLYTPGHCAGSITLHDARHKFVICGDLLFEGSVGRADLPTGDMQQLLNSIRDNILTLDDETIVYPGHGGATTVGNERNHNIYLK